MKFTTNTILSLCALSFSALTACAGGDGDGDNLMNGDGDTMTGDGDAMTGDGDTMTGDGDTSGTGGGGSTDSEYTYNFDSSIDPAYLDYEENFAGGMGGAASTVLAHESTDGDPSPGSVQVTSPFNYTGDGTYDMLQKSHVAVSFGADRVDFTGGTLTARVKHVSGGSDDLACPLVAKAFAKSGANSEAWANGMEANLILDEWVTLTLDPSNVGHAEDTFDAASIGLIGVEVTPNAFKDCVTSEAVVLVDTLSL